MHVLAKLLPRLFLIVAALMAWGLVYHLIAIRNVGSITDFWATERIVSYSAFILAPALTFIPIARALRIPLYDLEAIAGWSTLAFTLTFINPGEQPPLSALLTILLSLVVSLATLFTLLSYAVGLRLFARRSQRYDFVRARREGYLISMFLVGLLLLSFLDVLTPTNGALLGLIIFLLEVFLLSRGSPRQRTRPADDGELAGQTH